jgi:hypothetical protein
MINIANMIFSPLLDAADPSSVADVAQLNLEELDS